MSTIQLLKRRDIGASAKLVLLVLPSVPVPLRQLPDQTGLTLRTIYRAIDLLKRTGDVAFVQRGYVLKTVRAARA